MKMYKGGETMQQDPKYKTNGPITKNDGTPIPEDEPVMVFRGKDKLVPALLAEYERLCREAGCSDEFLSEVESRRQQISEWQTANPDRTRAPN